MALAQLCGFMHPQLAPGDVKNRWYLGASIIGATAMAKFADDVVAIRLRCPSRGDERGEAGRIRSVRLKADTHDLLVVVHFRLQRDFDSARGVNASAAASADIALVLAGPHFRVFRAQRADLRRELDGRLLACPAGFGDADVERTGGHDNGQGRGWQGRNRGSDARDGGRSGLGKRAPYDGCALRISRGRDRHRFVGQSACRQRECQRQQPEHAVETHPDRRDHPRERRGLRRQAEAR